MGMLEIRYGIDTDRVGNTPRCLGQLFHCLQYRRREDVSIMWAERKKDVVVARVDRLNRLERLQLRVVLVEEHPVVG